MEGVRHCRVSCLSVQQPGRHFTHRPLMPLSRLTWHSTTSPYGSASSRSSSARPCSAPSSHSRLPLPPQLAHLQSPRCAAHSRTPYCEGEHARASSMHAPSNTVDRWRSPRSCLLLVPLFALLHFVHVFVDRLRPYLALRRPLRCTVLQHRHGLLPGGFLGCCYGHSPRTDRRTKRNSKLSSGNPLAVCAVAVQA